MWSWPSSGRPLADHAFRGCRGPGQTGDQRPFIGVPLRVSGASPLLEPEAWRCGPAAIVPARTEGEEAPPTMKSRKTAPIAYPALVGCLTSCFLPGPS